MNAGNFNVEEMNLINLYLPADSRLDLIKRLYRDRANQEGEIRTLIDACLLKLGRMTDVEYAQIVFCAAI